MQENIRECFQIREIRETFLPRMILVIRYMNVLLYQQVQHILASTSLSGQCVFWDLHKNKPIITVADTSTMVICNYVFIVTM